MSRSDLLHRPMASRPTVPRWRRGLAVVAALLCALLGPSTVAAAVLQVTTTDDTLAGPGCSLRAATLAADRDEPVGGCPAGDPGLDTIELATAVYTLQLADSPSVEEDLGETGDLDVGGPVAIVGAGRDATVVESAAGLGGPPARVLEVLPGGVAEVAGLTIRYGTLGPPLSREPGAGIAVGSAATLVLTDCRLAENATAGSGGGLFAGPRSTVTVEGCEVRDNVAAEGGGGLAVLGAETVVVASEVVGNRADDSRWGGGGVLAVRGRLTLRDTTLAANSAADAATDGSVPDAARDESGGGALAAWAAEVRAENTTFSGNSADDSRWGGGGVLAMFADVELAHATLWGNSADAALAPGGSLAAVGAGAALGTVAVAHSIVAAGSPGECGSPFGGAPAVAGTANLVDDTSCGAAAGAFAAVTGLDPLLADAGGPTRTHRLLAGSNAIDAAASCVGLAGAPLGRGQRGVPRPQGAACDAGAVERAGAVPLSLSGLAAGPVDEPGGTVAATLTFENLGPLPIDARLQPAAELTGLGTCGPLVAVAPWARVECAVELTVAGEPGPRVVELEADAASPDLAEPVTAPVAVAVADVPPTVALAGSLKPDHLEAPGGSVEIRLAITNTGTVEAVTLRALGDDVDGPLDLSDACGAIDLIAPGETVHCGYRASFVGSPGERPTRTLTVTVADDDGGAAAASLTLAPVLLRPGSIVFQDCFESGDLGGWSRSWPGDAGSAPSGVGR